MNRKNRTVLASARAARRRSGATLVVMLAFIVLLTFLLVAFFSRVAQERKISYTNAAQLRADELAKAALNITVGDLRQEMAAGSRDYADANADGQEPIYTPLSARTVAPLRVLTSAEQSAFPNLLRRSMTQSDFEAGKPNDYGQLYSGSFNTFASAVATSETSANGRSLSAAYWSKPRFTAEGALTLTAPKWILVTRGGPKEFAGLSDSVKNSQPGNQDYVVGRYAYNIYDAGGCLDINVAGRPDGLARNDYAKRSLAAVADLGKIPGISDQSALLRWRNARSAASASAYLAYVTGSATSFLSVPSGDQAFPTRQDLLNYAKNNAAIISGSALPYLTTFSREVNAPSFVPRLTNFKTVPVDPDNNSTSRPFFGDSGARSDQPNMRNAIYGRDDEFNPPLASVRWPSDATLTDGSRVRQGEPLLRKRFPLDRLAALTHDAVAQKSDSDPIYRHFGIYRGSASQPWTYDHGDAVRILTLAELREGIRRGDIAPRDPDFFEMLQAGIAVGSLGRDGGVCQSSDSAMSSPIGDTLLPDQNNYLQILQIGANIIDQADTDSFPTEIKIGSFSSPGEYYSAFGVEDLPYLLQVVDYSELNPPASSTAAELDLWFIFTLWNPHQNQSGAAPGAYPAKFRVTATETSAAYIRLWYIYNTGNSSNNGVPNLGYQYSPVHVFNPETSAVEFTAGPGSFRQPDFITTANSPTPADDEHAHIKLSADGNTKLVGMLAAATEFLRVFQGKEIYAGSCRLEKSPGVTFLLQYQDAGGAWRTYSQWRNQARAKAIATNPILLDFQRDTLKMPVSGSTNQYAFPMSFKLDPRTDRWSSVMDYFNSSGTFHQGLTLYPNPKTNQTGLLTMTGYLPSADSGFVSSGNTAPAMLVFNNENRTTPNVYYRDPDGVVRRGDSMYATVSGDSDCVFGFMHNVQSANSVARPLILNRPFQSVGELGYVFRDMPAKTLDFWTSRSADSALLDLFCVSEESLTVAGKVNLNTRHSAVLQALLAGAYINEQGTETYLNQEVQSFADRLVQITGTAPFHNKSDLVNRVPGDDTAVTPGDTWWPASASAQNRRVKANREAPLRALSGSTQTRVWNLMIDLVAQTGRYTQTARDLPDFTIEGEKHYWLHIAIDRYTGKIVDQQLEPVYE